MLALLLIGVTIALLPPLPSSPMPIGAAPMHYALTKPTRHLRATDDRVAAALFDGVRLSRTFAGLVETLDRSDVTAYIGLSRDLPKHADGRLIFAAAAHGHRYVRIQIRASLDPRRMIAILGHELQHAVEVASDATVVDANSLRRLYERIGAGASSPAFGFDTQAAHVVGWRVTQELLMPARSPRSSASCSACSSVSGPG